MVLTLTLLVCVSTAAAGQADSVYAGGLFELGDSQAPPGFPGMGDVLLDPIQLGPDWSDLFNPDRTLKDDYPLDAGGQPQGNGIPDYQELFGGRWAVFTADDVSLGTGLESTALYPDGRVYNATVSADHDLGNAYVYSTADSSGNVVLYTGVERLGGGPSHLEIEFNQSHIRLGRGGYGRGEPWQLVGSREVGDVLVALSFAGGALGTIEASTWSGEGWLPLVAITGEGCNADETFCAVCNSEAIDGGPWQNYDTGADPEQISTNRFIEVGVNVGALLDAQPDFTTVRLRTPQDIAFGYFAEGN